MLINNRYQEFVSRRCEEILKDYEIEKRRELCRAQSELRKQLGSDLFELVEMYLEEISSFEADKENYLYINAFFDGRKNKEI